MPLNGRKEEKYHGVWFHGRQCLYPITSKVSTKNDIMMRLNVKQKTKDNHFYPTTSGNFLKDLIYTWRYSLWDHLGLVSWWPKERNEKSEELKESIDKFGMVLLKNCFMEEILKDVREWCGRRVILSSYAVINGEFFILSSDWGMIGPCLTSWHSLESCTNNEICVFTGCQDGQAWPNQAWPNQ